MNSKGHLIFEGNIFDSAIINGMFFFCEASASVKEIAEHLDAVRQHEICEKQQMIGIALDASLGKDCQKHALDYSKRNPGVSIWLVHCEMEKDQVYAATRRRRDAFFVFDLDRPLSIDQVSDVLSKITRTQDEQRTKLQRAA